MTSSDLWTAKQAADYRESSASMYAPEVLEPTLDFLQARCGDAPALEFAIGTGRVGVALADRGVTVHGIELSEPMVAELRKLKTADELPVTIGDMATASGPAAGEYGLVFLVFNTITNLLTQDEQVACFANAARQLRPGGAFVIECLLPDLQRMPPGQNAVPFEVSAEHLGFDTYELVEQRLTSHHFTPNADGSYRRAESHHRYAWPAEMDLMARLAGLTLTERYSDWDRSPFTDSSRNHVSVWRTSAGSVTA